MRDKDGKPIVTLPEKHLHVERLDFSPDERAIYDALFRNAKSRFLDYAAEGSVLQCVPPPLSPSLLLLLLSSRFSWERALTTRARALARTGT